jgi:hypothetical protein
MTSDKANKAAGASDASDLSFQLSAETLDDLERKLRGVDLEVPNRTEGRETKHTERYTMARLVATLARGDDLAFPLCVRHRDRPDFAIESGRLTIGVEVTEAISENFAAYCALAEHEFPDAILDIGLFRWGAPKLSREQMRAKLRDNKITSDGWSGDSPEREWALWVQRAVDRKLKKIASPGFQVFDRNWLAAYDNLPLPYLHLEQAVASLRPLLADRWSRVPSFDIVFVERGPVIVRITKMASQHLVLNDLWP